MVNRGIDVSGVSPDPFDLFAGDGGGDVTFAGPEPLTAIRRTRCTSRACS